jgi:hypothetical protein
MDPLIHLDYKIDKLKLLKESSLAKINSKGYIDPRYPDLTLEDWKIGHYTSHYIEKIIKDFDVIGKPRFYWLNPYAKIPEHIDNGTLCSINIILTDSAAPIVINNKEYKYNLALLNTQVPHSVNNNEIERIMLKISIFNETFDNLASRIRYKI